MEEAEIRARICERDKNRTGRTCRAVVSEMLWLGLVGATPQEAGQKSSARHSFHLLPFPPLPRNRALERTVSPPVVAELGRSSCIDSRGAKEALCCTIKGANAPARRTPPPPGRVLRSCTEQGQGLISSGECSPGGTPLPCYPTLFFMGRFILPLYHYLPGGSSLRERYGVRCYRISQMGYLRLR